MVIKATNQEPVMELPSSMLGFEDVVVKLLSKKNKKSWGCPPKFTRVLGRYRARFQKMSTQDAD